MPLPHSNVSNDMSRNQGYSYRNQIGPDCQGMTVLEYLATYFKHSTPAEWSTRIHCGEVILDDRPTSEVARLLPGSILIWNRPGWVEPEVPTNFQFIHQDDSILVVEKPSGLPTLPGAGFLEHTLLMLVRKTHPEAQPLHRLGRATTGLVLFARSSPIASAMHEQWSAVEKRYRALAHGVANLDAYEIRTLIGPVKHPRLGTIHAASPTGKPSCSMARVIERRESTTLFEVDLHTGRPHQIRIHLASIGYPLLGDPIYAAGGQPRSNNPGLPGDAGYWLHAERLSFKHPATGQLVEYRSNPPDLLCESTGQSHQTVRPDSRPLLSPSDSTLAPTRSSIDR